MGNALNIQPSPSGLKRLLLPASDASNSAASRETYWRSLQTFTGTRVVIAIVLLIYISFNVRNDFWEIDQRIYMVACIAYLLLAIGFFVLVLYYRRRFLLQVLSQVLVDVAVISLLYIAAGGVRGGLGILYLFPLAGCAILAPLVWALFFVSIVTLVLLLEGGYQLIQTTSDASISQSGLYGAAFFAAVLVISRLAAKLIRQEELTVQHGKDLQLQQAINRLIIADMGDGILVVSSDGTVLTANPAAERMLGMAFSDAGVPLKLMEVASLIPIAEAFFDWMEKSAEENLSGTWPIAGSAAYVMINPDVESLLQKAAAMNDIWRELTVHLKLRFVRVAARGQTAGRTVIFLQDVSEIENQAQQLKLASMGRLTASIAHEVRNPLSAISYASSLLAEELASPAQARLLAIVGDNVTRLNQMIEDILKLSRKAQPQNAPLVLADFLKEILEEFRETRALSPELIELGRMDGLRVWFDPLHLREVVVNLLSNALRYASGHGGSIRIYATLDAANRLKLQIQDDGPPITPEIRLHLFEPFYTTSSKGTGLGLYLARELCLNNGAMLDYEYHMDQTGAGKEKAAGRFVILLAMADPL